MSWWEIAIAVVAFVAGLALELWIHDAGIFWHEPKADRRNWTPPR